MTSTGTTLVDRIDLHAAERPRASAYTLLEDGADVSVTRTFAELRSRALTIASWLAPRDVRGRPVLLMIRDGLQFIEAFLGCLYAGAIAVPMAFPRPQRQLSALRSIIACSDARAVLASRAETQPVMDVLSDVAGAATWLFMEDAVATGTLPHRPVPGDIAFLQYTSGSTSSPKGVVVTHGNLMCNEAAIQTAMALDRNTVFVGWLPLFHDMGLIGNVLQPLYLGIHCVLMPPVAFLQRPIRWLAAISKYRATVSGGPNFAYDLCVDRTHAEQRRELDLSSWKVAFNGAEPVKAQTLERFSKAFAGAGFRRSAFYPCYGMAENTLIVTGVKSGTEPVTDDIEVSGRVTHKRVVSCGSAVVGTRVAIVDPDTRWRLPDGEIGEIWVAGDSVARGYYRAARETEETFGARLATGEGAFLRTGDLGYLREGHLFVTGRIKELIIIRGRNHYPQDLEETAAGANPLLVRGAGAAVALESERAVVAIVHELTREGWRSADRNEVAEDVREAIAQAHGVTVGPVFLIRPGSLPRTSSGKIRRALCRQLIESGEFETALSHSGAEAGVSVA